MPGKLWVSLCCSALLLVGACGGSQPPAESPEPVQEEPKPEPKSEPSDEPTEEPTGEAGKGEGEGKGPAAEPTFKEDSSVDEAIAAVPQGTPRVNVEQDRLAKPLMEESLYKPCKMAPNQHFKLKVAIWDGKAVGIDLTATPKNDKVVACIKQQINGITWKDKVKSLNTVEYQF
ncbi:MAG: hypothetical protein HS104_32390 [Polyangiaceae bacterium]|nr:hypothetical protein [Polyangiaceae bacterium]MBK8996135.1 hypothetical protein [Myxococcales bacterium]MCL4749185.1 hypothetical protein [Myxococcales bacterium]